MLLGSVAKSQNKHVNYNDIMTNKSQNIPGKFVNIIKLFQIID